ncbi:MAG: hypothetical protein ACLRVT_04970 [Oscillospiraceae bacterium]
MPGDHPKTELPIGILTSMIGASCFIYLMVAGGMALVVTDAAAGP